MKLPRLQYPCQFGQGIEQIRDKAVIRNLEDWCFFVLVDGDDDLAVLHACQRFCQLNSPAAKRWPVLERQMFAASFQASKASIL
ncbi:hypothetical protein SAMN05444959_1238 [Paracoccus seriniphilus]|uniref:Uncharacterized protein n=1 Tax=Paracoccus seriniphilus TaxID=184748 RepID=A0A239Q320_9RHOB|nr:hypothetical protein SAMN05444959_1238 [Paracoccus seriniphilus]